MAENRTDQWSLGTLGLIMFGIFLLAMAAWWFLKSPAIVKAVLGWKMSESWILQWIPIFESMRIDMVLSLRRVNEVGFFQMIGAIYPLSLVFAPIPAAVCVYIALKERKHPTLLSRRQLDLEGILAVHGKNSTGVLPIIKLDLLQQDPAEWRSSEDPVDFAEKNRLLIKSMIGSRKYRMELNRERTMELLLKQLGPEHGFNPKGWKPTEKVMFGMLCEALFNLGPNDGIGQKNLEGWENAAKLRDDLNRSACNSLARPDLRLGNELYNKWAAQIKTHPKLSKLAKHFRYTRTLLMALYVETTDKHILPSGARGVMSVAEFRWLKPLDRTLHYVMSNVGRKVGWTESAAVFDQYNSEREAYTKGEVLGKPYLIPTIEGLIHALKEVEVLPRD